MIRTLETRVFVILTLTSALLTATAYGGNGNRGEPPNRDDQPNNDQPIAIVEEIYQFRKPTGQESCLGEDDALRWKAIGALGPGESFNFTPQYPGCAGHPAAVSITATWDQGQVEISTTVPAADFASSDSAQEGRLIATAPSINRAQLCMFPRYLDSDSNYTITVTNHGADPVHEVVVDGHSENAWPIFYYPRCVNADADGDGWNDAFEQTMAKLVYPNGYIDGVYQRELLWGSNYLSAISLTPTAFDEVDSHPADFDDNGIIDRRDVEAVERHWGQGNGVPLQMINPNLSAGIYYYHSNTRPWRRYDLDADGIIDDSDVNIVQTLVDHSPITLVDVISPTAKLIAPLAHSEVGRDSAVRLHGHVWDNHGLSTVEYRVNGKTICSITDPLPKLGLESPFYYCWWQTPKKRGWYEITVVATDISGSVTASPGLPIRVQ